MSGKKGSRATNVHPSRPKKRKFFGNRYTLEAGTDFTSASAKKLKDNINMEVPIASSFAYCILEFASVFSAISANVICKECKNEVFFTQSNLRGLGFKIILSCNCERQQFIHSCPLILNAYEVNRRFVFVMHLLGIGQQGTKLFCSLMDISGGIGSSTYYALLENIHIAASAVYDAVLKLTVTQEKNANEQAGKAPDELTVSGNGTWKKRGFSSLFGVSTLIGKYTGKVLDTMVMSSFCGVCNFWKKKKTTDPIAYDLWYEAHQDQCDANPSGSSGKMEINAITQMFSRSLNKYGVKYLTYIGDGDSKTFNGIINAAPYEENTIVEKECVGHVEKRMGTRLRNAKKSNEEIGGEGTDKLTDKIINEMTKFYGLAIRQHSNSIEEMQKAIWATFYHKCSSDENPQHQNCPEGNDSWCKWRQAEAKGELGQFLHDKPPLAPQVQEIVKPVYEDLSRKDLLTRCLGAETQNDNESLYSLIWTIIPKHLHCGPKIVEIATFLAAIIFNEGFEGIIKILATMGCSIGREAHAYVQHRDEGRIARSERRLSDVVRGARIEARMEQGALREFQELEEGALYGPSIAD
ncbi:uncharacterized protein [Prorops nasuta]|uniref:uncharacterized protein n=1 Tax=Prorops nasuta TaxID=863751 RepID=UPI0034CF6A09